MLFIKNLKKPVSYVHPLIKDLNIRRICSLNDLDGLEPGIGLEDIITKRKLAVDIECFIAVLGKKVIHTSLVNYKWGLGPMLGGCDTIPEFRGRHISPAVYTYIFRYLKDKGFKKVYISCSEENISSKKAILRSGFKICGPFDVAIFRLNNHLKKIRILMLIYEKVKSRRTGLKE